MTSNFFMYLIQSNLGLILFYTLYHCVFRNAKHHGINRFVLYTGLGASLLLPLLPLPGFLASSFGTGLAMPQMLLEEISIGGHGTATNNPFIAPSNLFITIYFSGALLFLGRFAWRIARIARLNKKGEELQPSPEYKLIKIPGNSSPFSFMGTIYWPAHHHLTRQQEEEILAHERVHVQKKHSIDILFCYLVQSLHWFNPLSGYFQKAFQEVHEFQADTGALAQGIDQHQYLKNLANHCMGFSCYPLANHFNNVPLKKRILMMTKQKAPRTGKTKILLLAVTALTYTALIAWTTPGNGNTKDAQARMEKTPLAALQNQEPVYFTVEEPPKFQDSEGFEAFREHVASELKYPAEAKKKKIEGKVFVQFVVSKTGKVKDVKIVRPAHELLDKAALEVIANSPDWIPGKEKGQAVNVAFTMPVNFKL